MSSSSGAVVFEQRRDSDEYSSSSESYSNSSSSDEVVSDSDSRDSDGTSDFIDNKEHDDNPLEHAHRMATCNTGIVPLTRNEQRDYVDTQRAKMRSYVGVEDEHCFRNLLAHVVRCVFDTGYLQSITSLTDAKTIAWREMVLGDAAQRMWNRPALRADSIIQSEAWREDYKKALITKPFLSCCELLEDEQEVLADRTCEVCRITGRRISYSITLTGKIANSSSHYDVIKMYEHVRTVPGTLGTKEVSMFTGRYCMTRACIYHDLVHIWFKIAQSCYTGFSNLVASGDLTAEAIANKFLNGKFLEAEEAAYEMYTTVINAADNFNSGWWRQSAVLKRD